MSFSLVYNVKIKGLHDVDFAKLYDILPYDMTNIADFAKLCDILPYDVTNIADFAKLCDILSICRDKYLMSSYVTSCNSIMGRYPSKGAVAVSVLI